MRLNSPTNIEFDFPPNVFIEKEMVKVSVKFGEEIYFMANDRIQLYVPMVLYLATPRYLRTDVFQLPQEISIYGSHFWDT